MRGTNETAPVSQTDAAGKKARDMDNITELKVSGNPLHGLVQVSHTPEQEAELDAYLERATIWRRRLAEILRDEDAQSHLDNLMQDVFSAWNTSSEELAAGVNLVTVDLLKWAKSGSINISKPKKTVEAPVKVNRGKQMYRISSYASTDDELRKILDILNNAGINYHAEQEPTSKGRGEMLQEAYVEYLCNALIDGRTINDATLSDVQSYLKDSTFMFGTGLI
jgi:hypothetical protein